MTKHKSISKKHPTVCNYRFCRQYRSHFQLCVVGALRLSTVVVADSFCFNRLQRRRKRCARQNLVEKSVETNNYIVKNKRHRRKSGGFCQFCRGVHSLRWALMRAVYVCDRCGGNQRSQSLMLMMSCHSLTRQTTRRQYQRYVTCRESLSSR